MEGNKKILFLNLKAKWYDMIEAGIKKEEYREIKDFWTKRLRNETGFKHFDYVTFVYGYTRRNMTFEVNNISIKEGNTEWGAEYNKNYYVIEIGGRIK